MKNNPKIGKVIIPANTNPWPHEKRVARILAKAGYVVEFIPEGVTGTADVYLNKTAYEIKSPRSNKTNTIEHRIKDAINNQSCNLIIDSSRIKGMTDYNLKIWLINKCREQRQIKKMLLIDKRGNVIDIKALI